MLVSYRSSITFRLILVAFSHPGFPASKRWPYPSDFAQSGDDYAKFRHEIFKSVSTPDLRPQASGMLFMNLRDKIVSSSEPNPDIQPETIQLHVNGSKSNLYANNTHPPYILGGQSSRSEVLKAHEFVSVGKKQSGAFINEMSLCFEYRSDYIPPCCFCGYLTQCL